MNVETISPELALVDERLDTAARLALPDVEDCLVPSVRARMYGRAAALRPEVGAHDAGRFAWIPLVLLTFAFGISALPWSTGRDGVAASPVTKVAANATASAPAKPVGERVRWKAVRGADFYNVIFWRNGARALDLWPSSASVHIPRGTLAPGTYQWFVYPAFESGSTRRYGRVVAQGQLRI
jgi:hypothetical protein